MKAEDKSFDFLATPSYYDIPFFQRAYVWDEENWSELLSDLTATNQNHFLGSIILKNEVSTAGSVARYLIIDGQQRLTTLSILLRACYDHIVKHAKKYGYDETTIKTCEVNMQRLLFVPEGGIKQSLHVKINHSRLDRQAYESVVSGEMDIDDRWEKYTEQFVDDSTSSIIKAYSYFRDELLSISQESIDYLWELLVYGKIKFLVNINLDTSDNEQAIFDTVNSSGVRLSSADTIKNLLYQKYVEILRASSVTDVDKRAVEEYENTWISIFLSDEDAVAYWNAERQYGRMKRSNIENFLHSFAVVEGFFNPAENSMAELPQEYRSKVSDMDKDTLESFLMELHDYAEVFKEYFFLENDVLSFNDYIKRLFNICNALEVSTFYPYILQQIYVSHRQKKLSEEELKHNLFIIEKYVILNAICKGSTKNYNNECKQLVDKKRTPEEILYSCIYISEDSFVAGLKRMTTNKLPTLLLFWIELYQRSELNVDVKSLKYEYTLEHIMPQKWSEHWSGIPIYDEEKNVIEDTDEIERIRNRAIYELGNMTLLNSKLNTSISNSAFKDKLNGKNGKKGIKDLADLRVTKAITEETDWNEDKIYERTHNLEKDIRSIWDVKSLPETVPAKKNSDGDRHQLRLAYWERALPIIRSLNQESYNNVNPTTSNWVSGTFGIGGFCTICYANYDSARVDYYLGKGDKDKNKLAFDTLYSNKEAIEGELGISLKWDRADEYKASWVSYTLEEVSISNKDDWEKMAEFHGKWSNEFRKIMTPYLENIFPQNSSNSKSPEEVKKLEKIAEIAREWMSQETRIIPRPERSNRTCTRFLTETMSNILPDIKDAPSGWNTDNHYFYEIVNRNGKSVAIILTINSRNITENFRRKCDDINAVVKSQYQSSEWVWWRAFRSSKIFIPDDLDKAEMFVRLDKALEEVFEFERDLNSKLRAHEL